MAIRPDVRSLTAIAPEVLNAIRNSATQNYKNYVPYATPDAESIKGIGNVIMQFPALQNEFISALMNRIGRVIVTSRLYDNPWSIFKKGILEMGETVEEIFVNIAEPFQFDPAIAETELYKRATPDIKSAFHVMNYQKFYKVTVTTAQLKQAFLTWDGITDLIARIVDSMYTGAAYDEFQTMKYMLAKHLLAGHLKNVTIPVVNAENMKAIVSAIKGVSNKLTYLSPDYNMVGVKNATEKRNQYIIMSAEFDATMDVEVLASAFNMDKAEFMGRRIGIDGFGELDVERLGVLFNGDPEYTVFSQEELELLNSIPAVIVGENFFMVFDNHIEMTENYNGQGLYWNYFYHTWKTFSVSPFENAVMFVEGVPSVTSVGVSPSAVTLSKGATISLEANVVTENFASKAVTWTSSSEFTTVDESGNVKVGNDETAGSVTITATSVFDNAKSAQCVITIA